MKILAMSDLHGNLELYEWCSIVAKEHEIDALVLAGDLLSGRGDDLTAEEAQLREAKQVIEILQSLEITVFYIMGNDDVVDLGYEDTLIHAVHGVRHNFGEYNFVGYQFSPPFMGGIFEKPEKEIAKDLSQIELLLDEKTIFVTHSPAYGILDIAGYVFHVGSRSISNAVKRHAVRAHIHGHVHKCFGREGIHFNVAAGRNFRGVIIDLDELTHAVVARTQNETALRG